MFALTFVGMQSSKAYCAFVFDNNGQPGLQTGFSRSARFEATGVTQNLTPRLHSYLHEPSLVGLVRLAFLLPRWRKSQIWRWGAHGFIGAPLGLVYRTGPQSIHHTDSFSGYLSLCKCDVRHLFTSCLPFHPAFFGLPILPWVI